MRSAVFRVDASTKMGVGHVMRCLTLANELRSRGVRIRFVCREHTGNLNKLLKEHDFRVSTLRNVTTGRCETDELHASWLMVTQQEDANQTIDAIAAERPDWVVVDHYSLDIDWERRLRPYCRNIIAIDDLANRRHDCDILLDQNYFADKELRYQGLVPTHCKLLVGPFYALLHPEYFVSRKLSLYRIEKIQRVFVFFGGSDLHNMTGLALEALSCADLSSLNVDLVIGANNPHRRSLEEQARRRPRTMIYRSLPHLAALMSRADIAIGAGGTTTWERLALRLPSLVITVADNQIPVAVALDTLGHIRLLGNAPNVNLYEIRRALNNEIEARTCTQRIEAGPTLCDGEGVFRVAEQMLNPHIGSEDNPPVRKVQ